MCIQAAHWMNNSTTTAEILWSYGTRVQRGAQVNERSSTICFAAKRESPQPESLWRAKILWWLWTAESCGLLRLSTAIYGAFWRAWDNTKGDIAILYDYRHDHLRPKKRGISWGGRSGGVTLHSWTVSSSRFLRRPSTTTKTATPNYRREQRRGNPIIMTRGTFIFSKSVNTHWKIYL